MSTRHVTSTPSTATHVGTSVAPPASMLAEPRAARDATVAAGRGRGRLGALRPIQATAFIG
eukprot:scaffold5027_cov255-Prasinococcus_capsulatus_cf.AAC.8